MIWAGYVSGISKKCKKFTGAKAELPEDPITTKLIKKEIPTLTNVGNFFGDDEVIKKTFYFSLALLEGITRREREDPYMVHPVAVASKADYRYDDILLPSNFKTTPFGKKLGFIHELKEEVGKDPIGAYVVEANVRDFFGDELADGLRLMTSKNGLIYSTIECRLDAFKKKERGLYTRLEPENIKSRLEWELENVYSYINDKIIVPYYKKLERKLSTFVDNLKLYHPELSVNEREDIISLMTEYFINPLKNKIPTRTNSGNIVDPAEVSKSVRNDFEHFLEIIANGDYVTADPKLIRPADSPYLADLEKTFYQDDLNIVMEDAFKKVIAQQKNGQIPNDSALEVAITKGCDVIANAATMENHVGHAISQFRKSRRYVPSANGLIKRLNNELQVDTSMYERLDRLIDYLNRILVWRIETHLKAHKDSATGDNIYDESVKLFTYMLDKIKNDENKNPSRRRPSRLFHYFW